jgi:hypothetical protein
VLGRLQPKLNNCHPPLCSSFDNPEFDDIDNPGKKYLINDKLEMKLTADLVQLTALQSL